MSWSCLADFGLGLSAHFAAIASTEPGQRLRAEADGERRGGAMNLVRAGAALAALGVHGAFLGAFLISSTYEPDATALQSGAGKDDLTIIATVTMQTEESLGLDAASVQRQAESAGGQAQPKKRRRRSRTRSSFRPKRRSPRRPSRKRSLRRKPSRSSVRPTPRPQARPRRSRERPAALSRRAEARRCRFTTAASTKL